MTTSAIRRISVPVVLAVLLIPISSSSVGASAQRAAGSTPSDALPVPLVSVVCSTPQTCVAIGAQTYGSTVGSIGARTENGGGSWASTSILSGVKYLGSLSCLTSRKCVAVGGNPAGNLWRGAVVRTLDAGRTWTLTSAVPKSVGLLREVSCPTTVFCMAVGSTAQSNVGSIAAAMSSNDSGRSWKRIPLPKGEKDLSLVTCTTRRNCIAVGEAEVMVGDPQAGSVTSIIATDNGGATWTQRPLQKGLSPILGAPEYSGITCAERNDCLLVGYAIPGDGNPSGVIAHSANGGKTWSYDAAPPDSNFLNAVSCPSPVRCVIVGGGIEPRGGGVRGLLTTTDGGLTWTSRTVPMEAMGLEGISCQTVSSCIAVGYGLSPDGSVEPSAVIVTSDGGDTWTSAS